MSTAIPTKRVVLSDSSQIPSSYSTTPGGTWFSTTPGGTRIVYDRSHMLHLRNSPLSQTPPKNLAHFTNIIKGVDNGPEVKTSPSKGKALGKLEEVQNETDDQFQMDM
jgi:hypothetical protein